MKPPGTLPGRRQKLPTAATVLLTLLAACQPGNFVAAPADLPPPSGDGGVVPDPKADLGPAPIIDTASVPQAKPAVVAPTPTAPPDDDGHALAWPAAPLLDPVLVAANRDSAVVVAPSVSGARDYRVFALPSGVTVATDGSGRETVTGTTLFCAGYRQHNAPALSTPELLRLVEVTGLGDGLKGTQARLVVEAIDAPCPFPGVQGGKHGDVKVVNLSEIDLAAQHDFSVYTEQEIRARYGNLIVNGHGPSSQVGSPAAPASPRVLARTTLLVTPLGVQTAPPTISFFDDFSVDDPPAFVGPLEPHGRTQQGKMFQNKQWSFYSYGADLTQFFYDRGQLHMLLADWAEDIMSTNVAYPRRPVQLGDNDYLHVTYEVASDSTGRRYWWLVLCGAGTTGQTMGSDGKLAGNIIQTPFFQDNDGRNPSVEGWNCLQLFPQQGWPYDLPPSMKPAETDLRVMVNKAGDLPRGSVVNVSPKFFEPHIGPRSWFRQLDAQGQPTAPILDDQQLLAPRTHYDVYIRRDRVVLYVNGEQRLCNDFGTVPLTMAEAALGFGQVYYHSAAERQEFSVDYWDKRGQVYYLENTPFIDQRHWDNVGFSEHVVAPAGFDASTCHAYQP